MTRSSKKVTERKYGCFNRNEFSETVHVQDGWEDVYVRDALDIREEALHFPSDVGPVVRVPRMVSIPFVNSTDCMHDASKDDRGCAGCKRQKA